MPLESAQEVGLLDRLPPGLSRALSDLRTHTKAFGRVDQRVNRCAAVI